MKYIYNNKNYNNKILQYKILQYKNKTRKYYNIK